jgi:hypothetical protein
MAFNGSGVFNRLYSWAQDAANAIFVSSSRMDSEMDGMATGLSTCLTKDGQSTPTANIPLGTFKLTGVGTGSGAQDAAVVGQVMLLNGTQAMLKTLPLTALLDNGNSGTSKTIDLGAAQYQKMTMTGNCAITLTAPLAPATLHLDLTQDGTGSRTYTTSPVLKWPTNVSASEKLLSTAASARDLLIVRYNGTDYIANLLKTIS